ASLLSGARIPPTLATIARLRRMNAANHMQQARMSSIIRSIWPHDRKACPRLDPHIADHQGPAGEALRGLHGPGRTRRLAPASGDDGHDIRVRGAGWGRISDVAVLPAERALFPRQDVRPGGHGRRA